MVILIVLIMDIKICIKRREKEKGVIKKIVKNRGIV